MPFVRLDEDYSDCFSGTCLDGSRVKLDHIPNRKTKLQEAAIRVTYQERLGKSRFEIAQLVAERFIDATEKDGANYFAVFDKTRGVNAVPVGDIIFYIPYAVFRRSI